jgi:hypothetical protein
MLSCYQTLSLVPFLVAAGFLLESVTAAETVIDWRIELDGTSPVEISFSEARLSNEIIFKYNAPDPSTEGVSYTVTKHDFDDCEALVDQADPVALSVTSSFSAPAVLTVPIDVVQSQIELADVYDAETGIVAFCLKVQFSYNGAAATFHKTKVSFPLIFEEQFAALVIEVDKVAVSEQIDSVPYPDYLADPFPCSETFEATTGVTSYKLGTFC